MTEEKFAYSSIYESQVPDRNVYIPFYNDGNNTATYDSFTNAGYSSTQRGLHKVLLKDITSL